MKYLKLIILLILFTSCERQLHLDVNDYAEWINKNSKKLMATSNTGDWFCSLAYLPAEWMALQETGGVEMKNEEIKKLVESYQPVQHYILKISTKDTSTAMEKNLNDYFAFGMQKDIFLIEDGDTLPCILFHFENTYSLTGEHTFNLGFENKNRDGNKILFVHSIEKKFNDAEIHLEGNILSELPLLKLEEDAI